MRMSALEPNAHEAPIVNTGAGIQNTVPKNHNDVRSIKLTEKNGVVFRTKILYQFLKYVYTPINKLVTNPQKKKEGDVHDIKIPRRIRKQYDVSPVKFHDWKIYDIRPKNVPKPTRRIMYFPGGSFALAAQPQHISLAADVLCRDLESLVTIVLYPLAPHNKAHDIIPKVFELYQSLTNDSQFTTVDLAGDSSGGNLALVIAQNAALHDLRCPKNLMLIAPSLDMSMSNPEMKELEKIDVLQDMTIDDRYHDLWIGELKKTDVWCSPLFNDDSWAALAEKEVKIHLVIGTWDILEPDTRILNQKLNEAGMEGEWLKWDGMMHCFPLMFRSHITEAEVAARWITDVMKRNV